MRCCTILFLLGACSGTRTSDTTGARPPADPPPSSDASSAPPADASASPDATIAVAPPPAGPLHYVSDCSFTNPIARSPCTGTTPSTRGLPLCSSLSIVRGQSCGPKAPSCYVETTCDDGRHVASEFLDCAEEAPATCRTRSSKQFKHDVHYLTAQELEAVVHQVQTLPLATFHYNDRPDGDPRLGFLIEDAPSAPFVTSDGRHVDLYALLASSIATLQAQDKRIRALEEQLARRGGR